MKEIGTVQGMGNDYADPEKFDLDLTQVSFSLEPENLYKQGQNKTINKLLHISG